MILQENPAYSKVEDFTAMIETGGMGLVDVWDCPTEIPMYYVVTEPAQA